MARRRPDYVSGEGSIASQVPGLYAPGSRNRADIIQKVYAEYSWILNLVSEDPSMQRLFDWVLKKFQENQNRAVPLDLAFTQAEFDREFEKTEFRKRYTAYEAQRRVEAADPRLQRDFEFRTETTRNTIRDIAERFGVPLSDSEIEQLTEQATFQGWDEARIRRALEPILQQSLAGGGDLTGAAGDVQTQLLQWATRQGISIPKDVLARLVSSGAFGRQGLEDMKAELRRMYLVGAYPGWAKQIEAGADPYDLAAPFRGTIASLLELNEEEVGLDDPLLGQAMQGGMTLTDLRKVIRQDPRWQYTDNAYQTYENVGTDLLKMFGFR